ncbi:MAG: 50S ribosome-binding GTPase, partial [Planctomycetes bacterium]|nr:50S ribosome-binding GTPase [Planctomycetota bacterium]
MSNVYCQLSESSSCAITVFEICGNLNSLRQYFRIKNNKPLIEGKVLFVELYNSLIKFDEALMEFIPAVKSFTGIDSVIITIHGGEGVSKEIKRLLNTLNFKEISYLDRAKFAFVANRIDKIQLEATELLLDAKLPNQIIFLSIQKSGYLSNYIKDINEEKINRLLTNYENGKRMSNITHIMILGQANSGKSTLFNKLVGKERALVFDKAGTTLDIVNEYAEILTFPFMLYDCAGFKDKTDQLDDFAYNQIMESIPKIDFFIFLYDATNPEQIPDHIVR